MAGWNLHKGQHIFSFLEWDLKFLVDWIFERVLRQQSFTAQIEFEASKVFYQQYFNIE